jgi:hypothetical protein
VPEQPLRPAALKRAWVTAEKQAMAELGFRPLRTEVYAMDMDRPGDWEARVVLPKQSRGRAVGQEYPQAGVVHRPTERLIRELKGYGPGEGTDSVTVGTAGRRDLPTADHPALTRLRVADAGEIPDAVAQTARTVREVFLPLLRAWADPDRLAETFDGPPPPSRPAHRFWLERRAVQHHLRGDDAAARAALDELAQITGNTGIAAADVPDRAFADGLRARLAG